MDPIHSQLYTNNTGYTLDPILRQAQPFITEPLLLVIDQLKASVNGVRAYVALAVVPVAPAPALLSLRFRSPQTSD